MKKKNFRHWICLLSIPAFIFSCNSNNKDSGNPGTKDSPVVSKKEPSTSSLWTTNSDLILGSLLANFKIDGAQVNVDSAKITIRPKSDFSAIEISCSQGELMLKP